MRPFTCSPSRVSVTSASFLGSPNVSRSTDDRLLRRHRHEQRVVADGALVGAPAPANTPRRTAEVLAARSTVATFTKTSGWSDGLERPAAAPRR